MPVSYRDIEDRKIGEQTRISSLADQKVEEDILRQESEVAAMEQEVNQKEEQAMQEDAMMVIEEMEKISEQGGDHIEYFNSLPKTLQGKVSELLTGSIVQAEQQQDASFEPLPTQPQQQNGNITNTAKAIAEI